MPHWLIKVLNRIHQYAAQGRITLTAKAYEEVSVLGLGPEDVRDVLISLRASDAAGRYASSATGEWMYIFKPRIHTIVIYVKLILRHQCVVVSFHQDDGEQKE